MKCHDCKKPLERTDHYFEVDGIVDGHSRTYYLCPECADKDKGVKKVEEDTMHMDLDKLPKE